MRSDDLLARFGGDEFVAILTSIDVAADAVTVAGKIHDAVAPPIPLDGQFVEVSISIGIAMTDPGQDPELALRHADTALYQAKHQGRARTVLYQAPPA